MGISKYGGAGSSVGDHKRSRERRHEHKPRMREKAVEVETLADKAAVPEPQRRRDHKRRQESRHERQPRARENAVEVESLERKAASLESSVETLVDEPAVPEPPRWVHKDGSEARRKVKLRSKCTAVDSQSTVREAAAPGSWEWSTDVVETTCSYLDSAWRWRNGILIAAMAIYILRGSAHRAWAAPRWEHADPLSREPAFEPLGLLSEAKF